MRDKYPGTAQKHHTAVPGSRKRRRRKLYSKAKASAFRIAIATWPLRRLKSVGYKSKLR